MAFDNPANNLARQNALHQYYAQMLSQQKQSSGRRGDLTHSMIDRVHKAKPGCSACGK